jgi:hypothetical protein
MDELCVKFIAVNPTNILFTCYLAIFKAILKALF